MSVILAHRAGCHSMDLSGYSFLLQLQFRCSYEGVDAEGRGLCSSFPLTGMRSLCLSQSHTQSVRAAHIITTSHSIAPYTHLKENPSGSVTQPCIWRSSLLHSKAIVICTGNAFNAHNIRKLSISRA